MGYKLCLALTLGVAGFVLANTPPAELPSADQILKEMQQAYATCSSYSDTGEALEVFHGYDDRPESKVPFKTVFVRPNRFRFEFEERLAPPGAEPEPHQFVLWADGVSARVWWSRDPGVKEYRSIEAALGGPTGISNLSAPLIAGVLMPEHCWGAALRGLKRAKVVGHEEVDGASCHKLEATTGGSGEQWTVWIDEKTHLVRQVYYQLELSSGRSMDTTIRFQPKLNVEILPETFVFEPPS